MYRCEDCGRVFITPKFVSESRGEFWGMPCSEEVAYCPYPKCDGSFYEITDIEEISLLELEEANALEDKMTEQQELEDMYYDSLMKW